MNVLGLRISRRVLLFALVAVVAITLYRKRHSGFPSFTFRQRTEP